MADSDPDTVGDVAQLLRLGRVVSVDRAAATCTVSVGDPDGGEVTTDDIPWATLRTGETIIWAPPSIGEQVILVAPGGDIAQAVALPGVYCAAFPAPDNGSREFVRFKDGAEFGYDPATGEADVSLPGGGRLVITAPGGVAIEGDVEIEGELTATGDVRAGDISLQQHTHSGVQSGGSSTGAPE